MHEMTSGAIYAALEARKRGVMKNRSYEERHQAALGVFDAFMGGSVAEPERGARSFRRQHGALGTFAFDVVMGDVLSLIHISEPTRPY